MTQATEKPRPPRGVDPAALARAAGPEGRATAEALLAWYDEHRRVLPWREQPGPYRTWVSEIMLQQTRVDTVLPRYERFLARFPTVEALAAAELDEVLSEWSGLGYYSRARNLHRAAGQVVARGGFPEDLAGLRSLAGVGEYVAGAIASIALGLDAAAVDGNVERVLARFFAHGGSRTGTRRLAESMLPSGRAGDFNQALMDLGSGVCTPRRVRCSACPLRTGCLALATDQVDAYPPPKKKRVVPERAAVAGVLRRRGRVLLVRRPAEGLFGGLFELPGGMLEEREQPAAGLERWCRERLGFSASAGARLGEVRHTLTHMRLTLHLHELEPEVLLLAEGEAAVPELSLSWYTASTWVPAATPGDLGLSTLARKALALADSPHPQASLFP